MNLSSSQRMSSVSITSMFGRLTDGTYVVGRVLVGGVAFGRSDPDDPSPHAASAASPTTNARTAATARLVTAKGYRSRGDHPRPTPEPVTGVEPATFALQERRSTN